MNVGCHYVSWVMSVCNRLVVSRMTVFYCRYFLARGDLIGETRCPGMTVCGAGRGLCVGHCHGKTLCQEQGVCADLHEDVGVGWICDVS